MFGQIIKKGFAMAFLLMLSSQMLFAQAEQPIEIAKKHLSQNLKTLKLSQTDIAEFAVQNQVVSKHNKLTHLYLIQTYQGIPVHNAMINMNIIANGEVLSVGNRFIQDLNKRVNTTIPQISMEDAIWSMMNHFRIAHPDADLQEVKRISATEAVFDHTGLASEPIEVKLVYQPTANKKVRLAWNVSFYTLDGHNWYNARIDAVDGQYLDHFNQVIHCEFHAHGNVCEEDHAAFHAHEHRDKAMFLPPGDDHAYRAYPLFVESPNHGDRELLVNPADAVASPFGWHDIDGIEGAEFTITRGNNVHAYHDIFSTNASSGDEPDGGDSLCFDFPLDLAINQPYTQLDPLVTNLFVWNNYMHDVWYQYGFDEASGNFQVNNYDNGGIEGDWVRAEALDGSGTNNANFATPADGNNPRMQMYLWGGSLPSFPNPSLMVSGDDDAAGTYEFAPAAFGAEIEEALLGEIILVEDGTDPSSDACEPILNGADIDGKIAMIDRGNCQFGVKCLAAENEGAIAVIICNNNGNPIFPMAPGTDGGLVTIPAIMVSLADCNTIKLGLGTPELEVEISSPILEVPDPGPTGRSSDLDNGVIVHEYTHGISIRLTGGAGNSGCLSNQEQAGEGWSDWFALAMTTNSSNFAAQGRGIGTYAAGQPTTGGGIRTWPYSRDMNVNPHTYADINSESVPHGVGSVFCVTIWDMYWNLVDEYGFDEDLYSGTGGNNMAMQLVLDGLKLQSCNPTFLDARDAILEADIVNYDGANQCLIWETFARRGIGFSAEPGGVEAFDLPDACNLTYRVNKTGPTEATVGEIITYELVVTNGRAIDIENATVADQLPEGMTFLDSSSSCNVTEDNGLLFFNLGLLVAGESITCTYQVQVADEPGTIIAFEEDVETGDDDWTIEAPIGTENWAITTQDANTGFASFFAPNIDSQTDQYLISQVFTLNGDNPAMSFWHRYNTEANWDGGVIEISANGGDIWLDLGSFIIQNAYDNALNDNPDNALSGRDAFNGNSGGWIQTVVDLSTFVGSPIQVRFRFGSDGLVGAEGWYVDDIQVYDDFYSITNVACVDEGEDQGCSEAVTVIFGGSTSTNEINQEIGLVMAPNPTKGLFTLALTTPSNKEVNLRILSIDGKLLMNQQYNTFHTETIDMSNYGAGVYLVQLRTENGITSRKLIVE